MKNILLSFTLAVALIGGTIVLNYAFSQDDSQASSIEFGNDLSDDNGCLRDLVFDKNGNILSDTTYRWNDVTNTKGDVVTRVVYACN